MFQSLSACVDSVYCFFFMFKKKKKNNVSYKWKIAISWQLDGNACECLFSEMFPLCWFVSEPGTFMGNQWSTRYHLCPSWYTHCWIPANTQAHTSFLNHRFSTQYLHIYSIMLEYVIHMYTIPNVTCRTSLCENARLFMHGYIRICHLWMDVVHVYQNKL